MVLNDHADFLYRKSDGRGRKGKIASTLRKMAQIRNTCERPYAIIGIGGTGKKNFKGKQEIFDSCVEKFSERMTQIRNELLLPDTPGSDESYKTADIEKITEFAIGLFTFYWKDDIASKFRKMLMIERYRNPDLNRIFEELFVNGAVAYEEKIFAELIADEVIKKEDPHIIAVRFYSPIYYLLQKYDMWPEKEEEATKELTAMIREFCDTYRGKNAETDSI